jgi:3-phosphoshikimate 1-carboxyvinyltransferase
VKSAIMLAGLYADGPSTVTEPEKSRDHTERMLSAMGAEVSESGSTTRIAPPSRLAPLSLRVPGDISSAAPWLVLAACHPDAEILLEGVNVNPTRTGLLDILQQMGASVEGSKNAIAAANPLRTSSCARRNSAGPSFPAASCRARLTSFPGCRLACFAEGETVVKDAKELVVKNPTASRRPSTSSAAWGAHHPREDGLSSMARRISMAPGSTGGATTASGCLRNRRLSGRRRRESRTTL